MLNIFPVLVVQELNAETIKSLNFASPNLSNNLNLMSARNMNFLGSFEVFFEFYFGTFQGGRGNFGPDVGRGKNFPLAIHCNRGNLQESSTDVAASEGSRCFVSSGVVIAAAVGPNLRLTFDRTTRQHCRCKNSFIGRSAFRANTPSIQWPKSILDWANKLASI